MVAEGTTMGKTHAWLIHLSFLFGVVVALGIYMWWYTYELPHPHWWDDMRPGQAYTMHLKNMNEDVERGYSWDGKFRRMGGTYNYRHPWVRTEYVISIELFKDQPTIKAVRRERLQRPWSYPFRKIFGWLGIAEGVETREDIFTFPP